jgi:hypothetical protein
MGDVAGKPLLRQDAPLDGAAVVRAEHPAAGVMYLYAEQSTHAHVRTGTPQQNACAFVELLFTENETNLARLFGGENHSPYTKDAFHRYLIQGETAVVNPDLVGTKCAALYACEVAPGATVTLRLRLTNVVEERPFTPFEDIFEQRQAEADAFYAAVQAPGLNAAEKLVQRQAFAGMLWSKQLYYYDIPQWLSGDPAGPPPPASREYGRNKDWGHLTAFDVFSMPDKWEYPWFAAWDLAFHCLPLALVDPDFAKRQIVLMTREWYMNRNGQLPAYEWAFGDVNPPVHIWAAWRVYQIDARQSGTPDRSFLEGVFHKMLLNFTWWVNRKDADDRNVFQGGFLGLDNISLFDRSAILPTGGHIDQADGTAWMASFCLTMMRIALELAQENPVYQDLATKFLEHFLAIAHAMSQSFGGRGLWDEGDGFFYDVLHLPDGSFSPLKVRSLVGLIPLLAVEVLDADMLDKMPDFQRRLRWFVRNRPHLSGNLVCSLDEESGEERRILGIVTPERLARVLTTMLAEDEFLSPFGLRSLSKAHETPYHIRVGAETFSIRYHPAESQSGLFGGNSNWRGPVWFPINYLLIEALRKHHHYYGDEFQMEYPTGSGTFLNLAEIARLLSRRLVALFLPDDDGKRPFWENQSSFSPELLLFHEYFDGDTGAGLGASHQTGWTGLVATLLDGGRPASPDAEATGYRTTPFQG